MPTIFLIVSAAILLGVVSLLIWGGRAVKLTTGIIVSLIGVGIVWSFIREPGCIRDLREFAEGVEASVEPVALQAWATNILAQHTSGSISAAEIPDYVRHISTQEPEVMVSTTTSDEVRPCVSIVYGGGFGHWGLKVGGPDFKVPTDIDWSYYIQWKPGIYFWTQTK